MNNGIFQCMISLMGNAIGPIIATQLLLVTDWRTVFMLVGIPGLIMAAAMFFLVREPEVHTASAGESSARPSFNDLFRHRNVPLAMEVERPLHVGKSLPLGRCIHIAGEVAAALVIEPLAEPGQDDIVEGFEPVEPAHRLRRLFQYRPCRIGLLRRGSRPDQQRPGERNDAQ
jgi:hypothetical protein